ncbi:hypothetical protein APY03_5791 [Variovorax sp. WDL1]|nr:hypothetical protein APY03_5791 [Variovorax sp. WDL1]
MQHSWRPVFNPVCLMYHYRNFRARCSVPDFSGRPRAVFHALPKESK